MTQQTLSNSEIRMRMVDALWRRPGLSRNDLAEILDADKSSLSRSAGRLLDAGMLQELSLRDSGPKGGRPSVGLALRGDWGLWLGVELMPGGYRGLLVDWAGEPRARFSGKRRLSPEIFESVLEDVHRDAFGHCEELGIRLRGAGLSVPGPVDPETGLVLGSRPLRIEEPMDLAKTAANIFAVETIVDKDVNCACRSEYHFTERSPAVNFLFLFTEERDRGLALGLGIMISGRLFRGDHGAAGEILSVYRKNGHAQLAIDESILSRAGRNPGVLDRVVDELCPQLSLIVNVLDIDRVVLGGLFEREFHKFAPSFYEYLRRRRTYPALANPQIVPATRKDDAVAFGAAIHFTENLERQPFWRAL